MRTATINYIVRYIIQFSVSYSINPSFSSSDDTSRATKLSYKNYTEANISTLDHITMESLTLSTIQVYHLLLVEILCLGKVSDPITIRNRTQKQLPEGGDVIMRHYFFRVVTASKLHLLSIAYGDQGCQHTVERHTLTVTGVCPILYQFIMG